MIFGKRIRLVLRGVSLSGLLLLLLPTGIGADNALIMPKAGESLLLDAVSAGGRLLVAGEYGHILFSDDGGVQWTQAEVPTRQMLTALHFPTPQHGWAVGHDGLILASQDGGAHWALQRDGLLEQQSLNRERLRAALRRREHARQELLQATTVSGREALLELLAERELDVRDAGDMMNEAVHAPPLFDVFFLDALRGFAVGAFNTLLRTTDGGASWLLESRRLENPDEYHLNAITGSPDGKLWIAAEGGLLLHSADAGKSWQSLSSPYSGSWFGIIRAPDADALLVFGLRGNVYRSSDAGNNWQQVPVDSTRSIAGGCFVNARQVLLAGAVGTLLVSDDGGRHFRGHSLGQRPHLSAVTVYEDKAVLVGQGGVYSISPFAAGQ